MPIGYAAVRVNITSFVVDGIDSDDLPDDRPLTAEVTFTPMIQAGKTLQYDDGGVTKLKAIAPVGPIAIGSTGDISNQGRDYVKLVAPTAVESNLSQLQWKATFSDIRLGGVLAPVKIDPIYFWVLPGDDINLADHVNVAASTAIVLSRGQRGYGLVGFDYSDGDLVALYESPDGIVESDPIPLPESGATSVDGLLDAGDLGRAIVKADDPTVVRSAIGAASTIDASWGGLAGKPAVVAAGSTSQAARQAIGAGTSNLTLGTTASTAKPGDYVPTADDIIAAGALTQAEAASEFAPLTRALPTGGADGQIPVKTSGGVVWQDPPPRVTRNPRSLRSWQHPPPMKCSPAWSTSTGGPGAERLQVTPHSTTVETRPGNFCCG